MNLPDFLKNFKIDIWYKFLIAFGGVLFLISLVIELKGITNSQGLLLGGALLSIGLGWWMNQGKKIEIHAPNAYFGGRALQTEEDYWRPTLTGWLFLLLGAGLLILFIVSF